MSTLSFLHSQLFVEPKLPETNLTGQTIIVTGANRGLGFDAARHLINLNASSVVVAVRSLEKGEEAVRELETATGRHGVAKAYALDMASSDSVKAFSQEMASLPRVDAAILNAGIYTQDFVLAEGFESTLTVNVVNTFLLAINLLPILRKSATDSNSPPRISVVSSDRHVMTNLPEWKQVNTLNVLSDPNKAKMNSRYYESKLLQIFMVRGLAQQLTKDNAVPDVVINCLTPGYCHSGLLSNAKPLTAFAFKMLAKATARSPDVGARTLVASVVKGPESHGKYINDGEIEDKALSSFVRSKDGKAAQDKLWGESLAVLEEIQPGIKALI